MSQIVKFVDELRSIHNGDAWHGPSLHEALKGLTPEQAAARPIAGAHSIWELVLHIAAWENVFHSRLEGREVAEPEEGDFPAIAEVGVQAWNNALANLNDTHERLIEAVAETPESALEQNVVGRDYTRAFQIQAAVRHHVYHTGQIAVLRRAYA
jgi:uncharacterized damage-inducible protein DinB